MSGSSSATHPLLQAPDPPADKRPDVVPGNGGHRHGHGLRSGQPVGIVVAGGEVADVVDVAEEERHRAELTQAAAGRAWGHREPGQPEHWLCDSACLYAKRACTSCYEHAFNTTIKMETKMF